MLLTQNYVVHQIKLASFVLSRNLISSVATPNRRNISNEKCPVNHEKTRITNKPPGWDEALPYHEIPGPKPFPIIGIAYKFLPGASYANKNMIQIQRQLRNEYGDIVLARGLLGKPDVVFCYDANDIEIVYRTEGQWPIRRPLETFNYFREKLRPDLFAESSGLLAE